MPQIPQHCCSSDVSVYAYMVQYTYICLCKDCFSLLLRLHLSICTAYTYYIYIRSVYWIVYKTNVRFKNIHIYVGHACFVGFGGNILSPICWPCILFFGPNIKLMFSIAEINSEQMLCAIVCTTVSIQSITLILRAICTMYTHI